MEVRCSIMPGNAVSDARELNRLWNTILGRVELEVDAHVYRTWVKATRALGLENGVMRVEASTPFACDWLSQRLSRLLVSVGAEITGNDLLFEFVPRTISGTEPAILGAAPAIAAP